MTDAARNNLTPEEQLEQCQGSLNAIVLGMIAYFKERELSVDEFVAFVGQQISLGWDRNLTAVEYLRRAATTYEAMGGSLRSLSGDETHAEATFTSWPPDAGWTTEGFLSFWGLSQDEADTVWDIDKHVAEHLGFDYQWNRQGDEVMVTVTRRQ